MIVPAEEEAHGEQRGVAAGVATFLLAIAVAAGTHASLMLGAAPAFVPVFATLVCAANAFTAFLLIAQARVSGSLPPFLLAGAYAFAACAVGTYLAFFPAAPSATWFWIWWHGGFPLFVLAYAVASASGARRARADRIGASRIAGGLAGVVGLVTALAILTLSSASVRPASAGIGLALALTALALGALVRVTKVRTVTQLWLAVALLASLLDCALTLLAGEPDTAGWYTAHVESLAAATAVLLALLRSLVVLFDRLARLSSVDGLTGLANRRSFDERLVTGVSLTLRAGGSLSLLMLEVDYFRNYTDRYGHGAGDEALRAVAVAIARALKRKTDAGARFGGEKFAVILPATGAAGAQRVAERIRTVVRKLELEHDGSPHGSVTVSIGVSTLSAHEGRGTRSAATLVTSADRALLRAKEAGRDCVGVADAPLPLTLPDGRAVVTGSG